MTSQPLVRRFRPTLPTDVALVVRPLQRGPRDPTGLLRDGVRWRAHRTPQGPVTLALRQRIDGEIEAAAEGPGTQWVLDRLPEYLGGRDDDSGFEVHHAVLHETRRRLVAWRPLSTGLVMEALVPAVIEQKVTGLEAFASYRRLVRRFGERAPGRGGALGLVVPPAAEGWARIPSWEYVQAGVDAARADTIVRAARVVPRLEEIVTMPRDDGVRRLRAVPGIGVWTAAEVRQRALGDADAVSYGDYHVATVVGRVLAGRPLTDAELATELEPYRGHRNRAVVLAMSAAVWERRGPRTTPRTHLSLR